MARISTHFSTSTFWNCWCSLLWRISVTPCLVLTMSSSFWWQFVFLVMWTKVHMNRVSRRMTIVQYWQSDMVFTFDMSTRSNIKYDVMRIRTCVRGRRVLSDNVSTLTYVVFEFGLTHIWLDALCPWFGQDYHILRIEDMIQSIIHVFFFHESRESPQVLVVLWIHGEQTHIAGLDEIKHPRWSLQNDALSEKCRGTFCL